MTDLCVVCEETLSEGKTVIVKTRGIKTLIECSKRRGDEKHSIFQKSESVNMHVACHKSYTREQNVTAAMKASGSGTRKVRSDKPIFDFKTQCFFFALRMLRKSLSPNKRKNLSENVRL